MDAAIETFLQKAKALVLDAFGDEVKLRPVEHSSGTRELYQVVLAPDERIHCLFCFGVNKRPRCFYLEEPLPSYFENIYANDSSNKYYFTNADQCEAASARALADIQKEIAIWSIGSRHFRTRLIEHAELLKAALDSSIEHILLDTSKSNDAIFAQLKVVTDHLLALPYSEEYYCAKSTYEKAEATLPPVEKINDV